MEKSDKISRRLRRQRRKKIEGAEAGLRKAKTGHRINEKKKKKKLFFSEFWEKKKWVFKRREIEVGVDCSDNGTAKMLLPKDLCPVYLASLSVSIHLF